MTISKRRQRYVIHTKTDEGTLVTFNERCGYIQKNDIPADTVKIVIPNNTNIRLVTEGAIPRSLIKRFEKKKLLNEYEGGYYIGTVDNPYFLLIDFAHSNRQNGSFTICGKTKIHPDCEVIYPSDVTNGAARTRARSPEKVTLGDLVKTLGKKHNDALMLENRDTWKIDKGKLIDANGDEVASLSEELDIRCRYYHGGRWWNSKELYPIAYPGALGFRWFKLLEDDVDPWGYISVNRDGEEEPIAIAELDIIASPQIFNFIVNYCGCFDSECG